MLPPDLSDLLTESDVEQKLILPLLSSPEPTGLGHPLSAIRTKLSIRRFVIGKGKEQKLYYPDYVVLYSGLPMLIVEAKAPNEDLAEAFREARLYALELNARFPASQNPASKVVCCNGNELIAGFFDSSDPILSLSADDINPINPDFARLIDFAGVKTLTREGENILQKLTNRPFFRATKLIGGQSVRNEEIGQNAIGVSLAIEYRSLFNPTSREERAFIVKNAYIPSRRRTRFVDPIDRIIRAAVPASELDARPLEDTENPREVIDVLRNAKDIEHQVLLLVGGVGSGKSTFVDYLREVALPSDIQNSTSWIHINMNNAPLAADSIYRWICQQIIAELQRLHSSIDFDDLAALQSLYSVELRRASKGALKLFAPDSPEYKLGYYQEIVRLQNDVELTTRAYIRYLCAERGRLAIVVLDNCDKRIRDEQLLMFQAAQWLQQEFRCLIILPLRDETYDNHRNEPPLDTALKDLVFRIEPPLFHAVLAGRIRLALREMKGIKIHSYFLSNSMRVEYPSTEQAFYLTSVLRSFFEHDRFLRRLIMGLAGRDLRRAMEIFLEFCTSGHISDDDVFRIRQSEGQYVLPYETVARVLLRLNRRYYDSDVSYVKNLLACIPEDSKPYHFTRLAILRWLERRFKLEGPTRIKGYHPVRLLAEDLTALGISGPIIERELLYLLSSRCIVAEHLRTDSLNPDDLIRLAPAGSVHLDLLENSDYLAAVAEDTWLNSERIASRIAGRIGGRLHYDQWTTLKNADDMADYLSTKQQEPFPDPSIFLENPDWKYLVDVDRSISSVRYKVSQIRRQSPWFDVPENYREGEMVDGIIRTSNDYGLFVEIGPGIQGLVASRQLMGISDEVRKNAMGSSIRVRIFRIDFERSRISLDYISGLEQ